MRKGMSGVAMVTAANFLAFYSMQTQKEEMAQEFSLNLTENQVSNLMKGEAFVPTNQAPYYFS